MQAEQNVVLSSETSIPKILGNYKDSPIRDLAITPQVIEKVISGKERPKSIKPPPPKEYIAVKNMVTSACLYDSRVNTDSLGSLIPELKDDHVLSGSSVIYNIQLTCLFVIMFWLF